MRDYIILNGVNSNTITGLLISTLPPITKPKIRTQTEEIDGRDGDIVTTLGYSAYDKEIQIGLYGNFNINEVIAYFNTTGTVTFSNEPDKYYNYQILDQIDYDKLIRFKTAKVKMHVQPFKYPLVETPVEINIQNVTGSGETISLDNTADAPITLALKGNTSQDGTPTPDAPIEVNTVTGKQEIDVRGNNNIFVSTPSSAGECLLSTGEVTTGASNLRYTTNYIEIPNNVNKLYISEILSEALMNAPAICFYNENKTFISGESYSNRNNFYFNIPNNAKYFRTSYRNVYTNFSIIPTNSYEINLGTMELCKIGDYQDYLYKNNNTWYIHKEIGRVVLTGASSESWSNQTAQNLTNTLYLRTPIIDGLCKNDIPTLFFSNYFKPVEVLWNNDEEGIQLSTSTPNIRLRINKTTTSSTDNFKTWLSTHNVEVYYVLADPTDEEITDNTLIGQLNALENARSYDPTTNISQNTANKPFIINATAVQKGSDTGNVDNIGNIYAKPTIDIEGSGIVEIYLDGNQIFNVDLSTINECVIDTTNLEAYNPTTTQLMNRQVTGDYSNFKIDVGDNQVKVSGAVTKATISNYTRWL